MFIARARETATEYEFLMKYFSKNDTKSAFQGYIPLSRIPFGGPYGIVFVWFPRLFGPQVMFRRFLRNRVDRHTSPSTIKADVVQQADDVRALAGGTVLVIGGAK